MLPEAQAVGPVAGGRRRAGAAVLRPLYVSMVPATLVLLAAGAVVTGTGSGMAAEDWPFAYGQLFPRLTGGLLYEHGHRLLAMVVGLLALLAAAGAWAWEPRAPVRRLATWALVLVVVQGLLGALTVWLGLHVAASAAHAVLAQGFFCVVVALAVVSSPRFQALASGREDRRLVVLAGAAVAVGLVQVLLGALLRHTLERNLIMVHLAGAVLAVGVWWALLARVFREHRGNEDLEGAAVGLVLVLAAQVFLGFASWVLKYETPWRPEPHFSVVLATTLHLVGSAALLGTTVLLGLRAARICRAGKEAA